MALPAFALWRGELSAVMRRWLSPAVLSERLELPLPSSVHASLLSLTGWRKRPISVALAGAARARARTRVPLLPRRWALLILNLTSAHLAMCGIYKITTDSSAITCTMAVTARKLASLLLSIRLFNRGAFVPRQWIGTVMVFAGSILYSLAAPAPAPVSSRRARVTTQT